MKTKGAEESSRVTGSAAGVCAPPSDPAPDPVNQISAQVARISGTVTSPGWPCW